MWRTSRRSASSADRGSTRCSRTSARRRSTRPTASRRTASSWRRSRPAGRVPAAPRPAAHDPAAQDQLPGQRLGDALAGREGDHQPVRRRVAPARRRARALRRQRPVRRPDERPRGHLLRRPDRAPTSPRPRSTTRPCGRSRSTSSASTGSPSTTAARSWSSRARGSRRSPSRSGSRDAGWEVINMTQYPEAYLCRELGMAVVNIALITDYDAGVLEGTEAVTAHDVLAVFEQNAERIRKVVLDMVGRFPAGPRLARARAMRSPTRAATATPPARRTSGSSRRGSSAADPMSSMPTTPSPAAPAPSEPMHGCVRCGARIPIVESMCERCNPLGLKAPAASQAHGTALLGVVARGRRARRRRAARGERHRAVHVDHRWRDRGPGGPPGHDLDHERRLERGQHHLPDRRPAAAAGSGPRRRSCTSPDGPAGRRPNPSSVVVTSLGTTRAAAERGLRHVTEDAADADVRGGPGLRARDRRARRRILFERYERVERVDAQVGRGTW